MRSHTTVSLALWLLADIGLGVNMPRDAKGVLVLDVPTVIDALKAGLRGPSIPLAIECCPGSMRLELASEHNIGID